MVYKNRQDLMRAILNWIEEENRAGKDVSDQEIADHFHISFSEAREIHEEISHGL